MTCGHHSKTRNDFDVSHAKGVVRIENGATNMVLTPDEALWLAAHLAVNAHDDGSKVLERMAYIKGEG